MAFDEALAGRIRDIARGEHGLTERRMFGGLAFLVNGNMAVSASGQGGLLLRVEPSRTRELAGRAHASVAVMRGREMDGWLRVDDEGVRTRPQLERWVKLGLDCARGLAPKK